MNERTSINSNSNLHKEKEMADFRKWLLAFAAIAVLLAVGTPAANAQQTISCLANAGVPPIVRAEGITELVGDVLLNCTGGTPTPVGNTIPLSNVTVFLNTNITSRIVGPAANASEALLLIDEPFPTGGPNPASATPPAGAATQGYCPVNSSTGFLSACTGISATGGGVGATGPYRTTNIFQGQQVSANSVAWLGVPLDAPGTTLTRTIRITNVRANACQLGVSSTLIPTQIVMFIAVNGSQQVSINNPQQTVAFIQPGMVVGGNTKSFLQCNSLNNTLVGSSSNTTTGGPGFATAQEGFASSFKARGYAPAATTTPNIIGTSSPTLQNVAGFPYNTESGFVSTATGGATTGQIGVADYGTRIMFTVGNVGAGISVFAPSVVPLVLAGSCASNFLSGCVTSGGYAVLVTGTDTNGNGGALSTSTPAAFTTAGTGPFAPLCQASSSSTFCSTPATAVTITGNTGVVVYEVVQSNPNAIEALVAPINSAFVSNTGSNLPGLGQITAVTQFAPQSTVATASSSAPIPRFCPGPAARNFVAVNSCSCNLLFPFVTNQAGFDTGIAIANTSLDIYGTAPQAGSVTLNYFGGTTGGGAAPAAVTSQSVPAGQELVFTVSNGGGFGVAATPGFQGYIIAAAKFQYCHGFAFISDLGAQKLAEGYLAIQLDAPGLQRTGQTGENLAH